MSAAAPAGRTVIEVLRLSTEYLSQHGSMTPRLDAELLLAYALGVRRIDLYLMHDRPLSEQHLVAARELVRRRASHEPVAYTTGTREFYTRAFAVTPAVLIPRPETETLVEVALATMRKSEGTVAADLGTGSGAIAVTLAAEVPDARVIAVDISPDALAVAGRNAVTHGVEDRITFAEGDWAGPLTAPVDLVVSNPPYVTTGELAATEPDVRDFEPRLALDGGAGGLDAYAALLSSLPGRVRPGGRLLLEVDPRRAGAVAAAVATVFPGADSRCHLDLSHRERVLEAVLP